ncbi:MAG TPA: hypothetical protein VGM67_10100 [Gemmatimonadaceae bacterium]|jgi:hypothetical protein
MMRTRQRRKPSVRRSRRGIALFVAMFFVAGVGALALSAIYLTANASLLGKSYEKEDDLKYASEAALAVGKAELNFNPAALPNTSYVALMKNKTLQSADGQPVPGVTVNLYVGQTGSKSGQFGRFASVVSEARDANGTGFVRRLELTQESFAKFAYWTNSEGDNIVFGGGDQLWGPVWSNDDIQIDATGAGFHDDVGTSGNIVGASYGTFAKGYLTKQKKINLPTLTTLSSLSGLASAGGMSFTTPTTGDESTVLTRVEFVAYNMNGAGNDSTAVNDGFFKVYTATTGNQKWLRGDWGAAYGSLPTAASTINCGDWHPVDGTGRLKFFPVSVHTPGSTKTWFDTVTAAGLPGGLSAGSISANVAAAHTEGNSGLSAIMMHAGARCYLGGDPHLAAVERDAAHGYSAAQMHIGGDTDTFTPTDSRGAWVVASATPMAALTTLHSGEAKYLFPLYRGYNTNTKGVMYFSGTVGVSGVLRGDITLYTPKTIVILDDLRYANDPAKDVCLDILGLISGANTVVADNALNTPETVRTSGTDVVRSLDDTPNLYLQSVIMALGSSFGVENFDGGPTNAAPCETKAWGRGCLYLTGGIIQQTRGAVAQTNGTGFNKRYSYDACAVANPPPYFPTTGRFQDNRYYELDPVRFNVGTLFKGLSPGS